MADSTLDFINDNVHGRVEVTPLERAIIDTPTFRRLSNISHLGFAYWVFPGARHSRAAHSIGTLHVMTKARQLGFCEQEQKLLRLAALLHALAGTHSPTYRACISSYRWALPRADLQSPGA